MKERLDVLLVKRNLAESREKAKAVIMAGNVFVDGQREDKAGSTFLPDVNIEVRGHTLPYVSRGGLKLEKALANFDVDVKDKVCTDVGSSTGGFTDCMLQNGAKKVFAIDVGRGQLDWKLRNDPRVICMEKTNIRYVTPEDIGESVDFSSIDVSFISLTKVLVPIRDYLNEDGEIVALIKPQFEAGREKVGKKGVVRDKSTHLEVIRKIMDYAMSIGFDLCALDFSPIKGPEGNIEYLIHLKKGAEGMEKDMEDNIALDAYMTKIIRTNATCTLDTDRIIKRMGVINNISKELTKYYDASFKAFKENIGEPVEVFEHYFVSMENEIPNRYCVILSGLSIPDDRINVTLQRIKEVEEALARKKESSLIDSIDSLDGLKVESMQIDRNKSKEKKDIKSIDLDFMNQY